jgi:hypothetical protein
VVPTASQRSKIEVWFWRILWNFDYFGGCSQANNPTLHASPSLTGGACLQQAEGLVLSLHLAFFRKLKHSGVELCLYSLYSMLQT